MNGPGDQLYLSLCQLILTNLLLKAIVTTPPPTPTKIITQRQQDSSVKHVTIVGVSPKAAGSSVTNKKPPVPVQQVKEIKIDDEDTSTE